MGYKYLRSKKKPSVNPSRIRLSRRLSRQRVSVYRYRIARVEEMEERGMGKRASEEGRLITERSEKRDLTSKGKHRRGVRPLRGEEGVEWILKLCLSERCCLSLTRISSCLLTSCERDIRCKLHALPPHIVALLYCQLFTLQSCLYFLSHILAVDAIGRAVHSNFVSDDQSSPELKLTRLQLERLWLPAHLSTYSTKKMSSPPS